MKHLLSIIFATLLTVSAFGQFAPGAERPTPPKTGGSAPQEQEWFDPTRKKEKVKEVYEFSCDWRIEAGYVQNQQRTKSENIMNPYLHGVKLGATVDFNLPYSFSVQTGLFYTLTYGRIEQHWASMDLETQTTEYIRHNIMEHQLGVPVRVFYNQHLWKKLSMFLYTGPKFEIGLAQTDYLKDDPKTIHMSEAAKAYWQQQGVRMETYDRYGVGDLYRLNVQYGVGGGFDWDCYRVQAGYDFGLNNLVKDKKVAGQHMWEWGWYVSFAYRFNQPAGKK